MSEIQRLRYKPFGLSHPTWDQPFCFNYDSAEDAEAAIRKVYGENSGHFVVEASPATTHRPETTTDARAANPHG